MVLWTVIFILLAVITVLSVRMYYILKDVRVFRSELESFDGDRFRKNLSVTCGVKSMEELAIAINRKTCELKKAVDSYRRMENSLKQSITSMTHDLRTPLTSIIGYLQLMKGEAAMEDIKKYMEVAEKRAKSLETLINGFFEISMIEAPNYPVSTEAVDIKDVLAQQVADYYESFKRKGISLQVDIQDKPLKVIADINALNRIINNLIGNAQQHSESEVYIKLYEDKKSVYFEISNRAENLSEEDIMKIFDRFYMADKVRNGERSGLGLSIVKALVEKLDGTITASYQDNTLIMKVTLGKSDY